MMTPESENSTCSFAPTSPGLEGQDCRSLVRRLLRTCGLHEIERFLEEESREASSLCRLPRAMCLCRRGLTLSHRGAPPNPRWTGTPPRSTLASRGGPASKTAETRPPGVTSPGGGGGGVVGYPCGPGPVPSGPRPSGRPSGAARIDYACGFCGEIGIPKTCTRRNDLRRHIDQFHNTNAQWLCQHRGCRMAFDWQTAYQIHLRNEHGGSQMRMDEAKAVLCPQTVFACGHQGLPARPRGGQRRGGAGPKAAIPRAYGQEGWADMYAWTGLQSPALTDAYYDVGSPLAPPGHHPAMLGSYVPAPP